MSSGFKSGGGGPGAWDLDGQMAKQAWQQQQRQAGTLTISDVERLSRAGVKIDFADIANRLRSDPPVTSPLENWTDALLDRYRRNWRARSNTAFEGGMYPFQFLATEHGDKIHVYVAPTDGRDPVVLVDDKAIFPSDALMASIYLMEKCK